MNDPARERLIAEVNEHKDLILKVAKLGHCWPCRNCGHTMSYTSSDGWLNVREIAQAVESVTGNQRGSVFGIALHALIREGKLELNNRFFARLSQSEGRS